MTLTNDLTAEIPFAMGLQAGVEQHELQSPRRRVSATGGAQVRAFIPRWSAKPSAGRGAALAQMDSDLTLPKVKDIDDSNTR